MSYDYSKFNIGLNGVNGVSSTSSSSALSEAEENYFSQNSDINSVALDVKYDVEDESLPCLSLGNMDEHSIPDYSDIYDSLSFVKLETNPEALVGRVSKVI